MAETVSTQRRRAHEHSDLNPRAVALFGAALVILLAATLVLVGWWFAGMQGIMRQREQTPEAFIATRPLPPKPHLQQSPRQDLAALHAAEDKVLQSYGWVDQTAGIGRMPITRAMEFLATHGLPAWRGTRSETQQTESPPR